MNPFRFGDPVSGEYYLERKDLEKSISNFLTNQINVTLVGPRRFGKTSFILKLLDSLKTEMDSKTLFVDLFNITSHKDFLQQLTNAIKDQKSLKDKFADWLKDLPSNLKPLLSVEVDSVSGNPTINLTTQKGSEDDVKQLIISTFNSLPKLSTRLYVAFDEFQTVGTLEDKGWLEATIRSKMQLSKNTSFIFSGSRRSIINEMFNDSSRPFYRSCQLIDFPSFGEEFTDWVIKRFQSVGVTCDREAISYLRKSVENTPNYVQMAGFHIVASGYVHVNHDVIDEVLSIIVKQNAYAYQTLLKTLTVNQQRVLRMAAKEKESIFSKDLIEKYEISSPSHVSQAIQALKEKQILDEGTAKGKVIFDDPLFSIWLATEFTP